MKFTLHWSLWISIGGSNCVTHSLNLALTSLQHCSKVEPLISFPSCFIWSLNYVVKYLIFINIIRLGKLQIIHDTFSYFFYRRNKFNKFFAKDVNCFLFFVALFKSSYTFYHDKRFSQVYEFLITIDCSTTISHFYKNNKIYEIQYNSHILFIGSFKLVL